MTLTNICVLVICLCALWMLEEAARADSVRPAPGPLPEDQVQDTEYLASEIHTLIHSSFLARDGTNDGADLDDDSILDDEHYSPPPGPLSRELAGLLPPFMPGGISWMGTIGDVGLSGVVEAPLPLLALGSPRERGIVLSTGPLAMDLYAISAVALYSDTTSGHPAINDGGFLAAVSLTGALRLELTETLYLGLGFNVYYLPTVNRIGFYCLGNERGPESLATFHYQADLGGWLLTIENRFRVYLAQEDLLSDFEVDEIATAGRYRFGHPDTLSSRSFLTTDVFFTNWISASASTQLDENWKFHMHVDHLDVWSESDFGELSKLAVVGADLTYSEADSGLLAWAAYNLYDFLGAGRSVQQFLAGVSLPLTPTFKFWAHTGLAVGESDGGASSRWRYLWEIGFVHYVNESLSQSISAGHSYYITDYGDDFLGSYGRYTLMYHPTGSSWNLAASIQQQDGSIAGSQESKYLVYGARAKCTLGEHTHLSFFATEAQYTSTGADSDRRIVGVSLSQELTPSIAGVASYQYSHHGSSNGLGKFEEQLFILSLTKSF